MTDRVRFERLSQNEDDEASAPSATDSYSTDDAAAYVQPPQYVGVQQYVPAVDAHQLPVPPVDQQHLPPQGFPVVWVTDLCGSPRNFAPPHMGGDYFCQICCVFFWCLPCSLFMSMSNFAADVARRSPMDFQMVNRLKWALPTFVAVAMAFRIYTNYTSSKAIMQINKDCEHISVVECHKEVDSFNQRAEQLMTVSLVFFLLYLAVPAVLVWLRGFKERLYMIQERQHVCLAYLLWCCCPCLIGAQEYIHVEYMKQCHPPRAIAVPGHDVEMGHV